MDNMKFKTKKQAQEHINNMVGHDDPKAVKVLSYNDKNKEIYYWKIIIGDQEIYCKSLKENGYFN